MSLGVAISPFGLTSAVVVLVVGAVGLTVLARRFGWTAPLALATDEGISFLPLGSLDAERQAVLRARRERRYQGAAVQDVLRLIDADETALKVVEG